MRLRPRQEQFVDACVGAVREHGDTLGVASTGFGKSVALAAMVKELTPPKGRALVIQHREELVGQNRERLYQFDPKCLSSVFDAREKSWRGRAVFGMVQSLAGKFDKIPRIDVLLIDEAHHVAAPTYLDLVNELRSRETPPLIVGVTATPARGDRKGLGDVFSNVADHVEIAELVRSGNLVRPRSYTIDVGIQDELNHAAADMQAVARIMDKQLLNSAVVEHWEKMARGRVTIAFTSTVAHAEHLCEEFRSAGHRAEVIHGKLPTKDRRRLLAALNNQEIDVMLNVGVLTEGFDSQIVSCVLLLRQFSCATMMTQMIGRGLRTVDPAAYPGIEKTDCVVIDFGTSLLIHGTLEMEVELSKPRRNTDPSKIPSKVCPKCKSKVPLGSRICAICNYEFKIEPPAAGDVLKDFGLSEMELIERSPFRWEHFWQGVMSACATIGAWAVVVAYRGKWFAITSKTRESGRGQDIALAAVGDQLVAIAAADDHMRAHGDRGQARKSKTWLTAPATVKQLTMLSMNPVTTYGMTKYRASCLLAWQFNRVKIRSILEGAKQ